MTTTFDWRKLKDGDRIYIGDTLCRVARRYAALVLFFDRKINGCGWETLFDSLCQPSLDKFSWWLKNDDDFTEIVEVKYVVRPYLDGWGVYDTAYLFDGLVAFPFASKTAAETECAILNAKHERMLMQVQQTDTQQLNQN